MNAVFGYCQGLKDNFGILWNGDYTFCCTDFDARTSTGNFSDMSIVDYLASSEVQRVVQGFNRFRVLHPYCKQCLGDRNILNAAVKQIGSICYFKFFRNINKEEAMKRAAIVSLCLIISSFIASTVFAEDTYYARCNIKVLKGNKITWVNWQASPYTIPAGTKLRVTRSGKKATFVREDNGEKL